VPLLPSGTLKGNSEVLLLKRKRAFQVLLAVAGLVIIVVACRALRRGAPLTFPATDAGDLRRADWLAKLGNWDAAGPIYANLENRFRLNHETRNQIYAHVSRYGVEEESSDLQKVSQELGSTLQSTVVQNDLQLMQRCLEIKAHVDLNLDGVSARPSLERLEKVATERKDFDAVSRASGELGIVAFLEGNSKDARNRILGSIYNAFASGDTGAQIRYLSLLGQGLAESQRPKESLFTLNRALAISDRTADSGFPKLVVSGKASALTQLGRYAEAHTTIEAGLGYARDHHFVGYEVDMLSQAGQLAAAQGQAHQAIAFYERAVSLAEQIRFNRGLAEVSSQLAVSRQRAGQLQQAIAAEQISIDAHLQMGEVYHLPHHLALKGNLQQALGATADARLTYQEAEQIVGTMLKNSPTTGVKRSVVSAMSEIYLGHFRLATAEHNLPEAYRVIEEARGRVAADRLRSPTQDSRPRPSIAAAERNLAALQIKLFDTQDERERNRIVEAITTVEEQTPFEEPSMGLNRQASLTDLQASLEPHETLLEYVLDEPVSHCLIIQRGSIGVARLKGRKEIAVLANRELTALKAKSHATTEGRELYSAVMQPIGLFTEGTTLIVVPDGELHGVPFGALVDTQNRYLLEVHAVDYAPSGTVLALLRSRVTTSGSGLLALGAVAYGHEAHPGQGASLFRGLESLARNTLQSLPATLDEIHSVAAAMHDLHGVVLSDKEATESNFKREAAKKPLIIHLAVHGFADKEYPDRAGLVLAAADPGEDGVLQVREIRRLPLERTGLVTLSACDTSIGRVEGEEGASSIVTAFLYAGSITAVASLWAIEDSSTSELMKRFYRELAQGQSKSSALRAAQIGLFRNGEETRAPFYWAAFTLTGDGSGKIEMKPST
jgi:CHAT domain-containing protein